MSPSKLPVWAVALLLTSATVAYGQATQAPPDGGPVVSAPPESPNPGRDHPTPQGGRQPNPNPSH